MRLGPYYPNWYLSIVGLANRFLGNYDEAIDVFEQWRDRIPNSPGPYIDLASTYAEAGREEAARIAATELLTRNPKFSVKEFAKFQAWKNPEDLERLLDGLRKAGLPESPPLPLPDRPSIAVLPFTNMSGDPEQEYFADGITEDLTTDLSKISGLFVIARNSAFTYKGKFVRPEHVARELGVRYVLEGSVRRAGDTVRINTQFIDTITGGHLWAERFDGSLADVFALQDQVAQRVVSALNARLTPEEVRDFDFRDTVNFDAYDALLRARRHLSHIDRKEVSEAKKWLEKAIELDPEYARAHVNLGFLYWNEWRLWGLDRDENLAHAEALARRAFELAPESANANLLLALVYLYRGEFQDAEKAGLRAYALGPIHAETLGNLGRLFLGLGRPQKAIEVINRAIRLDPLHPPDWLGWLARALFHENRHAESIEILNEALLREPDYIGFHVYLAQNYAVTGSIDKAKQSAAQILRLNPKFTVGKYAAHNRGKDSAQLAVNKELEALRKAGVPE